ncbi:MAG: thiolase domain-containing protein [Candidatus Helarchaeota archaeon]|nr:thiolase domain-containing protein [Candidatus Helarchaeota archaeon]
MRDVAIIGVGMTKFGKLQDKNLMDLLSECSLKAIEDSNTAESDFDEVYVACMCAETLNHMTGVASALVDRINLIPAAADHVKNGPASGGSAIKNAFYAIASGARDIILVAGAEKMTHITTPGFVTSAVATITHHTAERIHGVSLPSFAGLLTRAYMEKYDVPKEWITSIAVKNHKNGLHNPYAHFQKEITLEKALSSRMIADPLQLYDICPISDGGAAMVMCPAEMAKKFCDTPILVTGVGQATDTHIIYEREDLTVLKALQICSRQAYDMAKKTPEDMDVAELHDAFEILEVVESEDIGFFKKGEGAKAAYDGLTEIGGKIPINPSGGLKARGHPLGATGIAQVIELVWQLRNEAGKRQVKNAQTGITCNFGGFGNNIVSILVERM